MRLYPPNLRIPSCAWAWVCAALLATPSSYVWSANEQTAPIENPRYKPSGRSPAPIDITLNDYGYSANAPDALEIGDTAPDFRVVMPNGVTLTSQRLRAGGDVVIVFYRGHW